MAKGGAYEREICRVLSLWLSGGVDDDLFWRSAGSGSRATNRRKKNKSTKGHGGDIAPTCAEGQVLTDLVAIEVKRGYKTSNVHDLLDKREASAAGIFEKWVEQAYLSQQATGAYSWWLITRRDRREAMITMPTDFFVTVTRPAFHNSPPRASLNVYVKNLGAKEGQMDLTILPLDNFLGNVKVYTIHKLFDWWSAQ